VVVWTGINGEVTYNSNYFMLFTSGFSGALKLVKLSGSTTTANVKLYKSSFSLFDMGRIFCDILEINPRTYEHNTFIFSKQ